MTAIDLYFLGGVAHGRRLMIDDRMAYVELPRIDGPLWGDRHDADQLVLSRDTYQVRRFVITSEHPCVPHAAYARVYRAAVWDGMPPDVEPPARELLATRHDSEHRGRLPSGEAPDWWLWPLDGPFAGFRVMIG